ncbi:MAG: PadR family transcriptional regulator [Candidatus Pacearchaeota archaeon]|jgi:DNA-binding PadR family transcriptional regulator
MEIKGHLKIIVLKLLYKEDLTGYGLINQIKDKTGFWKPSPGSIYPLMNELSKKGLVKVKKVKNQKVYSITLKGKTVFDRLKSEREKAIENIKHHLKILELIEDKKDIKSIMSFIDLFKQEDMMIKHNLPDLFELKDSIITASCREKNIPQISKIIKEASKKIREL